MSAHQILCGALNRGETVFSVGSVEGLNFTVCAIGTNLVVISSRFERIQVITPTNVAAGQLVSCVNCCRESGKIAAAYGNVVRIFGANARTDDANHFGFQYQWSETHVISLSQTAYKVLWNLQGLRLLICFDDGLHLYQHSSLSTALTTKPSETPVTFEIVDEENETGNENSYIWECVWSENLAVKPKFVSYSPDGAYFAVSGPTDCMVKIWYQKENLSNGGGSVDFNFIYIQHPQAVSGFEWRQVPRFMSRQCVQNVLLTWCTDHTVRLYKEAPNSVSEFQLISNAADASAVDSNHSLVKRQPARGTRSKIKAFLKKIVDKKSSVNENSKTCTTFSRDASLCEIAAGEHRENTPGFHLCCTINAQNDCLLVPELDSRCSQNQFSIHWLNNKGVAYNVGVESLLVEALMNEQSTFGASDIEVSKRISSQAQPSVSVTGEETGCVQSAEEQLENEASVSESGNSVESKEIIRMISATSSMETATSKDLIDLKLDVLIRDWKKSSDVLFAVHPVDGSLLTWSVEWLDDGFRQPTISFTSRIPNAFSLSDATSLNQSMFNYFPSEISHSNLLQRNSMSMLSRKIDQRIANILYLLTHHNNGSLNLWHLTMEDNSKFNNILNISHASRMCGHRYKISQVIAHPVLPLVITTSHNDYVQQEAGEYGGAELILWKIKPVGPLCKCGGVRELARITSNSSNSFTAVTWLPAILPSSSLGSFSTSPSSCFIANTSENLSIYQVIVDAADFLAEIHASDAHGNADFGDSSSDDTVSIEELERSSKKGDLRSIYRVVSTQSSTKPGCILLISKIPNVTMNVSSMHLLHVFNEKLLTYDDDNLISKTVHESCAHLSIAKSDNKYYLVAFDKDKNDAPRLRLWLIDIEIVKMERSVEESESLMNGSSGSASHEYASALKISTQFLCEDILELPEGVSIISAEPAAGHLPSSNLFPTCSAPYHILISCDDDRVRFLQCTKNMQSDDKFCYKWSIWGMISNLGDSEVEMDGQIYAISSAHSGRFACAYLPEGMMGISSAKINSIKVAVYECESSGGVEWLREDTIIVQRYRNRNMAPVTPSDKENMKDFPDESGINVRLKWVSAEDGSHILTVALGTFVYFYTQVSQGAAQRNIVMMKEHDTHRRAPLRKASSLAHPESISTRLVRWLCIRYLELKSVDGLPPYPTTLGWVRDGLLIVAMYSEMRCYNQWNFVSELSNNASSGGTGKDLPKRWHGNQAVIGGLAISPSHSMLEHLTKKQKIDATVSSKQKSYKDLIYRVHSTPHDVNNFHSKDENVLDAISDEGLFEAARLASPILPQYHPKLLIELLNSGKTREVKAILLHVLRSLKQLNVSMPNPLSRASSMRKMSISETDLRGDGQGTTVDVTRGLSDTFDDGNPEYDELDGIALLPLHVLLSISSDSAVKCQNQSVQNGYGSLFDKADEMSLEDLDLEIDVANSRRSSISLEDSSIDFISTNFTAKHNRMLTEHLTHTHLPGLSSVDQMHLLAIADTLSHFSSDVMDKLTQVNAIFRTAEPRVMNDAATGYATNSVGFETVDEYGLRYLMAMKQHEYLMVCLPLKQKQALRASGLPSSQVIWALHSETETELLNAITCLQKPTVRWEEVRAVGIVWWLKSTLSLRTIIEKLAKAAFQQNQDPMDSSLFYMMMRKKNVLTHLFKTVRDQKMVDFFMHDFTEDKWKKAALKNAFVLMGKQRFYHAAAFFLLAGSLKDALQTVLSKLKDLQLAMAIIRLYETDMENQSSLMKELLYREIFGIHTSEYKSIEQDLPMKNTSFSLKALANRNPFIRSMSHWHLKEYTQAASTFVEGMDEINPDSSTEYSLSDVFNFYSFIRNHPLVIRQKLADADIQMGSTDQFLAVAKQMATTFTPADRRLYFRTASAHMASGCPLLALDVLMRLPKNLSTFTASSSPLSAVVTTHSAAEFDWSAPVTTLDTEELDLKLSDSEDENVDQQNSNVKRSEIVNKEKEGVKITSFGGTRLDMVAQHMKFVAALRLLVEELSNLANGFEVDGGQLRSQLLNWLENGVSVLEQVCYYQSDCTDLQTTLCVSDEEDEDVNDCSLETLPLHKALHMDRKQFSMRIQTAMHRRRWLYTNQKLLRAYTSYCTLHNSQNHRLTSSLMELLLLLMEVQQDGGSAKTLNGSLPIVHSFPLFIASMSPYKMFVSSPLSFIRNLCSDLLLSVNDIHEPSHIESSLTKVYKLYSLCQGLSSCLYQSLCDADSYSYPNMQKLSGTSTRFSHNPAVVEDLIICTPPSKWPGVDNLVALLSRKKEEDASQLRLLLVEIFVAVFVSLFLYAYAVYDARWLYRLAAHEINANEFAVIFGGGGESKQKVKPSRPPAPTSTSAAFTPTSAESSMVTNKMVDTSENKNSSDASEFRVKFNTKVFGSRIVTSDDSASVKISEHTFRRWVAPKKSMVQRFAEKPDIPASELGTNFDSDEDHEESEDEAEDVTQQAFNNPESFAWRLMRLALIHQQLHRMKVFLNLAGIELSDLAALSPRASSVFKLLELWIKQVEEQLSADPEGCSSNFLPNMTIKTEINNSESPLNKYGCLLNEGNTPFECSNFAAMPVKRVWLYLVRQAHLLPIFVRYIFGSKLKQDESRRYTEIDATDATRPNPPGIFKIIQRENEPIAAFCCSDTRPGWLAISTTRELQEMDIGSLLDKPEGLKLSAWMHNRADLDIALDDIKPDVMKDNDDYQLLLEKQNKSTSGNFITPFIIDRSRKALTKLLKRQVNNIRRMDSHPTFPYYVSGSSDGSIRLWEWGVGQPLHTPRMAGQYAKVTKVLFSCNGNKFASIDSDGILCLWRVTQGVPLKRPFYNQKCHTKSAADVLFMGATSTVLVTAGSSLGDENIAIWDTLMPQSKALVHSWTAHPEGSTSLLYLHNQQCLVSGGRHGDLCLWDVRQRRLRTTVKCFENSSVKCLAGDPYQLFIVAGSNDGDVKIWSADSTPRLHCSLDSEHAAKGGFSLRQVASTVQGVQQMYIDTDLRLYSCGADSSLKIRSLGDFT